MPPLHFSQIRKWFFQSPPVEWAVFQLRELLIGALKQGPIPQHVAFVMDGNRRFAKKHRIETVEGHNLGFEALARILEICYKSGVKVVTIYAFSTENFNRSKYEVDALMSMAKVKLFQLLQHGDLLERYGVSLRVFGKRELLNPDLFEDINRAVEVTSNNSNVILNVCVPYTSREEIAAAIKNTVVEYSQPLPSPIQPFRSFSETHISHNIRSRHLSTSAERLRAHSASSAGTSDAEDSTVSSSTTLYPDTPPDNLHLPTTLDPDVPLNKPKSQPVSFPDPESITPATLDAHMFTVGMPPIDLLVRTSGVERLSDFMLWQCHEDTKIYFLKCLWPEFDLWGFLPVLLEWQWKKRKAEELTSFSVGTNRK